MPTKHNKKRYQAHAKPAVIIHCTGRVYLRYRDEEEIARATKGDLMLFPSVEALQTLHQGEYGLRGYAGYFKLDVFDGKSWQPVRLTDVFRGREHYFGKGERPADTAAVCEEALAALGNFALKRTYREHYALVQAPMADAEEPGQAK
ncbi:MAG: hypothetical protein JO089_08150 [Alphaproteobacteria bacterium]|nr:hypothetical protein [Alphaproteobacteria bacterium]